MSLITRTTFSNDLPYCLGQFAADNGVFFYLTPEEISVIAKALAGKGEIAARFACVQNELTVDIRAGKSWVPIAELHAKLENMFQFEKFDAWVELAIPYEDAYGHYVVTKLLADLDTKPALELSRATHWRPLPK